MARPSRIDEKRQELLPTMARAFAELGYRRATTAELAQRCGVRENILYRLWPDKKAMFIAAIDYVYEQAASTWQAVLSEADDSEGAALLLLQHEARHHGESGLHRLIFAGLSEADQPEIHEALRQMYGRFQKFIHQQIGAHRKGRRAPDAALCAWAIIGLGNVANIARELGFLSDTSRRRMLREVGRLLLDGRS